MVKFFSQTHKYSEPWQTVTLAFFLRYPNPYATHVLSADVLSRSFTPEGTLVTTRLILKSGNIPKWLPRGIVGRAESWIVEQSEVDPLGKVVRCETRNLDHVKILSVRETVELREGDTGYVPHILKQSSMEFELTQCGYVSHLNITSSRSTIQKTEAKVISKLGWLARRAERYGHEKFQRNLERVCVILSINLPKPSSSRFDSCSKSRAGMHLIVDLLHQSRLQAMSLKHMHDVGLGYRLQPLTVQGTALDSFRPRFDSPSSASINNTSEAALASRSSDAVSGSQTLNEATDLGDRRRRKWSLPQSVAWLWRSPTPPPSSSSPTAD